MAANPAQISVKLSGVPIRGSDVVCISESIGNSGVVDLADCRGLRVAGDEGTGTVSGSYRQVFLITGGKVDRRSKYFRATKQTARLAAKGYKVIDSKLKIFDALVLAGCICLGLVLVISR